MVCSGELGWFGVNGGRFISTAGQGFFYGF